MAQEKTFTITKKNIPTIMEAISCYGDLPARRYNKINMIFEIMLRLAQDNIVNIKISHLAKMVNCSASLATQKITYLENHSFIKDITPEGVSSRWEINLSKLESIVQTYSAAKKIQTNISKHLKSIGKKT